MSIFNVGVSGLNAAQVGILTTSHNIANASTPGYNRQQSYQTTLTPMFIGSGYLGQGTTVETIRRVYNEQLAGQVLSAQTGAAEMDTYKTQISQIDNMLADTSAGLSPAMSDFFKAVQEMAANPASLPARQSMLSASQSLVARFSSLDQRLTEIRDGVNSQITSEVKEINSYAAQISEINQRIINAEAIGPGQPPNDLLDQRDQLIADLNTKIRVTTLQQSDGSYNVFIGNGQPLVIGTLNYSMEAVASPEDPERIVVALHLPTGGTAYMPESMITGGSLGGLVAFRNETLDGAQNALGRIAMTLAQNFNDQHALGQDLTGALGGDYFDMSGMSAVVHANTNNAAPSQLPTVTISNIDNLTTSNYRLSYDGTNYNLLRLSDNTLQTYATLPQTVDGFTISAGSWTTQVAGDSFLIQPTRNGAASIAMAISDPRDIAAAAPIRTSAALANSGTGSISAGTVDAATQPPRNANLQQPVTITFIDATHFSVTGTGVPAAASLPPYVTYTAGSNISYNGWVIQISGAPATGDTFTVGPNLNGVADNRNGVLLGALQTRNTMEGGTVTYQSAYSSLVAEVGNKARQVEVTGQAQQSLYEQAQTARDQASGVNLDEEAANLLRYQQAYQAAAKMLDVANKLFDEVLALGR